MIKLIDLSYEEARLTFVLTKTKKLCQTNN